MLNFKEWLVETSLSSTERSLLGLPKRGSKYSHPSESEWEIIRPELVSRSVKSNPLLDVELTAYTPGETLAIMNNSKIVAYHDKVSNFKVPGDVDTIVLVPCAKSKPWGKSCVSDFYRSYHQLREDPAMGRIYMATISEPLGVVPSDDWDNFPQYDNPGLFDDTAMQSSLFTKDWSDERTEIGRRIGSKRIMPFDRDSYDEAIDKLSDVIARFMETNRDKKFVSFVGDPSGKLSTHSDMIRRASAKSGIPIVEFLKKPAVGREKGTVYPYMKEKIGGVE